MVLVEREASLAGERVLSASEVWAGVDEVLMDTYSTATYHSWFAGLSVRHIDGQDFVLSAPSNMTANIIKASYSSFLEECLERISGNKYRLVVVSRDEDVASANLSTGFSTPVNKQPEIDNRPVDNSSDGSNYTSENRLVVATKTKVKTKEEVAHESKVAELLAGSYMDFQRESSFYSNMLFDSFVVGPANEFAFAAAKSVCESPAYKYNPLFIYGGSGLGKTHLLHAIGYELQKKNKNWKILYTTSEKFTNDVISAIKSNSTRILRDVYRTVDVLLLDDVQFIERKESTQEEFFNTFNELRSNMKQVVITADRPLREMPMLVDRLRTRIEGGLIVDIQPPDYEMRVAVLRKKLEETKHADDISSEVIDWVASHIQDNIRELEGAVLKLTAHAEMRPSSCVDIDVANRILADYMSGLGNRCINTLDIIREVESFFNLSVNTLSSNSRARKIVEPRHIAMYLCNELTSTSFVDIGKAFGGRDHTTVIHAVRKIKKEMESNLEIISAVNTLKEKIS